MRATASGTHKDGTLEHGPAAYQFCVRAAKPPERQEHCEVPPWQRLRAGAPLLVSGGTCGHAHAGSKCPHA